jgi:EmrB/QacA subfamily drug resistance transporter
MNSKNAASLTAETSAPQSADMPRPLLISFLMLVVMLMMAALDQTIVSTALPVIARDLHGSERSAWVFSAYLIASTVAVPLYGKLADMHGSKPLLLTAVGLFLLGSVLCGLSRDMTELILARGIQGAGGGGLLPLAMMSVQRLFPDNARAKFQGILGAVYGLSTMMGPLVGGYLVEHFSWRWAFFINLPLGLVAAGVLASQFPRVKPTQRGRMDYGGALLLSAGLVSLLLSTNRQPLPGVAISTTAFAVYFSTTAFAVMGVALIVAFVWLQSRIAHPLLPLSLFAKREFSASTLLSACTGFMLFAAVVFLPMYFQNARGLSPADSGLHLMPLMAGITIASIVCGRVLAATGRVRSTALVACTFVTTAFLGLGLLVRDPAVSLMALSACLLPLGTGIGALFPLVTVVAQNSAPMPLMGMATASPVMFRSVAGAVGVSVMASLFASGMTSGFKSGVAPQTVFGLALSTVMWAAAGASALAAFVSCGLPWRLTRSASSPSAPMMTTTGGAPSTLRP